MVEVGVGEYIFMACGSADLDSEDEGRCWLVIVADDVVDCDVLAVSLPAIEANSDSTVMAFLVDCG